MKVMIMAGSYPCAERPYAYIFIQEQVKALQRAGLEVTVLVTRLAMNINITKVGYSHQIDNGIPIFRLDIPIGNINRNILAIISLKLMEWLFKKAVNSQGMPDIIHAHFSVVTGLVATNIGEKYNIPVVLTEHSSLLMREVIRKDVRKVAMRAFKKADSIIVVSSYLAKYILDISGIKPHCIPNVVNTDKFCLPTRTGGRNGYQFISVGSLIHGKGHDALIQAFAKAFSNIKDVRLLIAGEGNKREELQRQIDSFGISDRVKLLGRASHEKLPALLQESNCFALASRLETFGVVFIEAASCGLPLLGTRCGGVETIINDNNGVLVNVDDISALAEQMQQMYENCDVYDKKMIAEETKHKYGFTNVSEEIKSIYEAILSSKRSS